jgi:hypothetical protein
MARSVQAHEQAVKLRQQMTHRRAQQGARRLVVSHDYGPGSATAAAATAIATAIR